MGLILRFRFWLSRLRYRFSAWRFKRRETWENFVIAAQQKQISAITAAWDAEVATLRNQIAVSQREFDIERRESAVQLRLALIERDQLDEVIARDRARIADETACYARREQEHKYGIENLTKKPS